MLLAFGGKRPERILRYGEHPAGAARAVVEQIGAGFELLLDWQEHQVRHQPHGVTRSPVFARFFVVLLVELAHQLLEDRTHRVVVDARWGEVDLRIKELADERANRIVLGQCLQLVAELEVVEDVLNVR